MTAIVGMLIGSLVVAADRPAPVEIIAGPLVSVDNVCAWPNLIQTAEGSFAVAIFNRPAHGGVPGDVEVWASKDGGLTWHRRGVAAPHQPRTIRLNTAFGLAQDGDLLLATSGWSDCYPEGQTGKPYSAFILEPWLCRSSDGGRRWDIDRDALAIDDSDDQYTPYGNLVRGADGRLRMSVYTCGSAPGEGRAWVLAADDDGRRWGDAVAIDADRPRNETCLLHLGRGYWLAAARYDGLTLYHSTDDAATWKCLGPVTGASQHPGHLLRLEDGRVLLTHGNRTPGAKGIDVRFSSDGRTFSPPRRVADFQGDGGYPCSAERSDGTVLTVYYAQRTAGHSRYHMAAVVWKPPSGNDEAVFPSIRQPGTVRESGSEDARTSSR